MEPPDSESLAANGGSDTTGLVYCRGRSYAFDLANDLSLATGGSVPASLTSANIYLDPATRTMYVDSNDPDHYGTYYANIRITLDEYPYGDTNLLAQSHIIEITITPPCS